MLVVAPNMLSQMDCAKHMEEGENARLRVVVSRKLFQKGCVFEHGGRKTCTHDSGCKKAVVRKGLCTAHGGR